MDEDFLRDLFVSLADVRVRRMFGGQGVYSGDRIVAVVVQGELYLKSDALSEPIYEAADLTRWIYAREGRAPTRMPYHRMPESALDDQDEADGWIAVADAASRRASQQSLRPKRAAKAK